MSRASSPLTSLTTLSVFSLCLSAAVVGTAGHVLKSYNTHRGGIWWLPIWRSHFDTRGLETLVGASVSLVVINALNCAVTFVKASFARFAILGLAALAAVAALVQTAFPAAVNNTAPSIDSIQTWTCQWAGIEDSPGNFSALCHESRFAYFTSIPIFVTQLLILGLAVQNLFVSRWQNRVHEEKGEELGSIMAPESLRGGFDVESASHKGSPDMNTCSK